MTKSDIINYILQILKDKYNIPDSKLEKKFWDLPLTGKHFNLTAYELVELLLELERITGKTVDINNEKEYSLAFIERLGDIFS